MSGRLFKVHSQRDFFVLLNIFAKPGLVNKIQFFYVLLSCSMPLSCELAVLFPKDTKVSFSSLINELRTSLALRLSVYVLFGVQQ